MIDWSQVPGAVVTPDQISSVVPQQVSMMQAQIALHAVPSPAGGGKTLLDDVQATVDASSDVRVKIAWAKASAISRKGLFVVTIAPTIPGLDSDAALDALFVAAANISV